MKEDFLLLLYNHKIKCNLELVLLIQFLVRLRMKRYCLLSKEGGPGWLASYLGPCAEDGAYSSLWNKEQIEEYICLFANILLISVYFHWFHPEKYGTGSAQ